MEASKDARRDLGVKPLDGGFEKRAQQRGKDLGFPDEFLTDL